MKKLLILALLSQMSIGYAKTTLSEAIIDQQMVMTEGIVAPGLALASLGLYSKSNYDLALGFVKEYETAISKLYQMKKMTKSISLLESELTSVKDKLFQLQATKSSQAQINAYKKMVEFSQSKVMAKKIELAIVEKSFKHSEKFREAMSMHNYKLLMKNVKSLHPESARLVNKSYVANRIAKTFIGVSLVMGTHLAYKITNLLLDGEEELDESERSLVELVLEEAMVVLREGAAKKEIESFDEL